MNLHLTPAETIARALGGAKRTSNGWQARCPCHDDSTASLSIKDGRNGSPVVHCHAGCSQDSVIGALKARSLWPQTTGKQQQKIVATYRYIDQDDNLLFEVVRFAPKDFRQRKPDGNGGWIWSVKDVQQVPYRLPELVEAIADERLIFIVEGEKDADSLAAWGVPATTNAGGSGKWKDELSPWLKGANVIVIPDNDESGRVHLQSVGAKLQGIVSSLRVLELPASSKDVSDWIKAGGTSEELYKLADVAPVWNPSSDSKCKATSEQVSKEIIPDLGALDAGNDIVLPPPRPWLLGNQFCRPAYSRPAVLARAPCGWPSAWRWQPVSH